MAAVICAATCVSATEARADWLFTPFVGGTFGGKTALIDLELGAGASQFIFGGSGGWLTRDRILGFEGEFAYAPRYFERDNRGGLVLGSNVVTLTFAVTAAAPLSLTRESLRPYLVGGAGLMHARIDTAGGVLDVNEDFPGMVVGGGAFGFISERTGFRFDLRHFRALTGSEETLLGTRQNRLSFWRLTVGVTLRY